MEIIDIESQIVLDLMSKCKELENKVISTKSNFIMPDLSSFTEFSEDINSIKNLFNSIIDGINDDVQKIYEGLAETINELRFNDSVNYVDILFADKKASINASDIRNGLYGNVSKPSVSFFEELGYNVDNGIVIIGNYKYDINKGILEYGSGKKVKVDFFVPNAILDLVNSPGNHLLEMSSDLFYTNIVTILAGKGEISVEHNSSNALNYSLADYLKSNAVLIVPYKESGDSYHYMHEGVIASTEFMEMLMRPKETINSMGMPDAKNVLIGFSVGANSSLYIMSERPDLYDQAFMIDFAPYKSNSKLHDNEKYNSGTISNLRGKDVIYVHITESHEAAWNIFSQDASGKVNIDRINEGGEHTQNNFRKILQKILNGEGRYGNYF